MSRVTKLCLKLFVIQWNHVWNPLSKSDVWKSLEICRLILLWQQWLWQVNGRRWQKFFSFYSFLFHVVKKVDSFNTFCIFVLLEDNQRWLILWRPTLTNLASLSSSGRRLNHWQAGVELACFGPQECEGAIFPHLCWPRLYLSIYHDPPYSALIVVMIWIWIQDIESLNLNLDHDRQKARERAVSLQVHAGATCN